MTEMVQLEEQNLLIGGRLLAPAPIGELSADGRRAGPGWRRPCLRPRSAGA